MISKAKSIIITILCMVLTAAVSIGGTYFVMSSKTETDSSGKEKKTVSINAEIEDDEEEEKIPNIILPDLPCELNKRGYKDVIRSTLTVTEISAFKQVDEDTYKATVTGNITYIDEDTSTSPAFSYKFIDSNGIIVSTSNCYFMNCNVGDTAKEELLFSASNIDKNETYTLVIEDYTS